MPKDSPPPPSGRTSSTWRADSGDAIGDDDDPGTPRPLLLSGVLSPNAQHPVTASLGPHSSSSPPPTRSYAAAAATLRNSAPGSSSSALRTVANPPKPKPRAPSSVLDSVAAPSFFNPAEPIPRSNPLANLEATAKSGPPPKPKKKHTVRPPYVDIATDEEDNNVDELDEIEDVDADSLMGLSSSSSVATLVPRGRGITPFVKRNSSNTRDDDEFPTQAAAVARTHPRVGRDPPSSPTPSGPRRVSGALELPLAQGPGWVAPRIVAFEGEIDAKDPGGVWPSAAYDVEVDDTVKNDSKKYLDMGTWVSYDRAGGNEPADKSGNVAAALKEQDLPPVPPLEEPFPVTRSDDVLPPVPSKFLEPSTRPSGYYTATRADLDSLKPHPHAYYSRRDHAWALFHPLPRRNHHLSPDPDAPELFQDGRPFRDELDPPLRFPFEPACADEIAPENREKLDLDEIKTLVGTQGTMVVYSPMGWYPCVIPRPVWAAFCEARRSSPVPNETPKVSLFHAVLIIYRAIEGVMLKGKFLGIPVKGKSFSKRIPEFDQPTRDIFVGTLGFTFDTNECILHPPAVEAETPTGKLNRDRLLRCFVELGLWAQAQISMDPSLGNHSSITSRFKLVPVREHLLRTLGGDSLPRLPKSLGNDWVHVGTAQSDGVSKMDPSREENKMLGLVPDLADEVIAQVYKEQKRLVPEDTPKLLGALLGIAQTRSSDLLTMLVVEERSKGLYTQADLIEAYVGIGAGERGPTLGEDHVAAAFTQRWSEVTAPERRRVLKEALGIISKDREPDSELLRATLASLAEEEVKPKMTIERAYRLLDLPKDTEEELLMMAYGVRVEDSPGQADAFKEALTVIAETRRSDALFRFLKTGSAAQDDFPMIPSVHRPVGLTNIANTCYLNSLLQYFFTVRELRETILKFSGGEIPEGDQLNRVGGRLVTKYEVERSRRFVMLMQGLFNQLIHAPTSAVTPETELAYLALVPSKEEDTESKSEPEPDIIVVNNTEATVPIETSDGKTTSVLGKRGSDQLDDEPSAHLDAMVVDTQVQASRTPLGDRDLNREERSPTLSEGSFVRRRKSSSPKPDLPTVESVTVDSELLAREAPDGVVEIGAAPDVEMAPPPPLPPRPPKTADLGQQVSTYMAFGRQNDVTECMDNVMFQIECALNPSSTEVDPADEAAGLLKRTFYGKMRQQLKIDDPTEKEPLRIREEPFFSLLVDVAEEGRDVYDGLDTVFDDCLVDIEGKQAQRRITLVELPPLLQIQLQRVQYDRKQKKIFKSNAHMSFEETISMDRYLEVDPSDVEGLARRDRTNECRRDMERERARLQELTSYKNRDISQVLRDTYAHILDFTDDPASLYDSEGSIDSTLIEASDLESEIVDRNARLAALRTEVSELWSGSEQAKYELVAVFIHRGTALSGHYYIYIRDSINPKRWLKYNDSIVTDVDPQREVFGAKTGDTNPYFLVYCRKDRLDAIDTFPRGL